MVMQTSFQDHRKNSSVISLTCYKYCNLPLFVTSDVALNEHRRFLFMYSFKTKGVNMAITYVLYTLKLKIWIKSNQFSKSFLLRNEAIDTCSNTNIYSRYLFVMIKRVP